MASNGVVLAGEIGDLLLVLLDVAGAPVCDVLGGGLREGRAGQELMLLGQVALI